MGNWNDTQEAYYGAQPGLSERPENKEGLEEKKMGHIDNKFILGVLESITCFPETEQDIVLKLCECYGITVKELFTSFMCDLVSVSRKKEVSMIHDWFQYSFSKGCQND